ncbi:MAG: metallophosphoesterase [Candidatus Aenigmatarchaeota archaeon]
MLFVNILVIGDIHNDVENIINYADKVSMMDFDAVICPGDFTDVPPRGFTSVEIAKLILEELRTFKKPIVTVPGNWDDQVLKYLEKEDVSIHGKGKIIGDVGFYGFGGAKTPFNTPLEPSEDEIEMGLKRGFLQVKNAKYKVQVTHVPPVRTKVDRTYSDAHIGSAAVRKFIEENQPDVAVCAHVHEGRGTDEIGKTKILNSGRFPEGYLGLITLKPQDVSVKIVNLI